MTLQGQAVVASAREMTGDQLLMSFAFLCWRDYLTRAYRRDGVDLTYRLFRFGKHMIVALTGLRSALRFLSETLEHATRQ